MGTSTTTYVGLVYGLSIFIASIAGMGSAFLANRIYPLKGGDEPPPPTAAEVASAVKKAEKADNDASKLAEKLAASDTSVPQPPAQVVEKEKIPPAIEDKEDEPPPAIENEKENSTPPLPSTPTPIEDPNREEYIQHIQKTFTFPDKEYAKDALDILETPRESLSTIPNITDKLKKLLTFLNASNAKQEVVNLIILLSLKIGKNPIAGADESIKKDLHKLIYPTADETNT